MFDTGGVTLNMAVDYVNLNVGTIFEEITTRDILCFFDDFIASSCAYDGDNDLWRVGVPRDHDITGV